MKIIFERAQNFGEYGIWCSVHSENEADGVQRVFTLYSDEQVEIFKNNLENTEFASVEELEQLHLSLIA